MSSTAIVILIIILVVILVVCIILYKHVKTITVEYTDKDNEAKTATCSIGRKKIENEVSSTPNTLIPQQENKSADINLVTNKTTPVKYVTENTKPNLDAHMGAFS